MKPRVDYAVIIFAVLAGVYLSLDVTPALLVTDEVAYSLMAHSLAREGRLDVWNGFDEVGSWELQLPSMFLATNGEEVRMYGVPAPLYAFVAYPFYRLWGLPGLFYLNILSYSILILIVYHISKIYLDERWSLAAAVAYALLTNSLSFTGYIIPHLLSTALVLIPAYLVFRRILVGGDMVAACFSAGLIAGVAIGVRYTNVTFALLLAVLLLLEAGKKPFMLTLPAF